MAANHYCNDEEVLSTVKRRTEAYPTGELGRTMSYVYMHACAPQYYNYCHNYYYEIRAVIKTNKCIR